MFAPDFYFTYVLEKYHREFQIIELLTVGCGVLGGILLVIATWKLWTKQWIWAAAIVGIMASATLFFAGEETSWGQTYFEWNTPIWWDTYVASETNFHNSRISTSGFNNLAGLFQIAMFGVLPLAWVMRERLGLPEGLGPAIPGYPVVFLMFVAFVYRESKNLVRAWYPHDEVIRAFSWGMNEHREMLVAVGLLFYGIYTWRKAKTLPAWNLRDRAID